MKIIKNIMKVILFTVLCLMIQNLIFVQYSNAAVEVKAGTSTIHKLDANNAFQYCYDMRYPTSTLGNNSLDPHLSTANDWGGAAYLGLSSYGATKTRYGSVAESGKDAQNGALCVRYDINGTAYLYYTLNGNKTGVLNYGKTCSWIAAYKDGSTGSEYSSKLYLDSNARLVNKLSTTNTVENTKGQAFAETFGWNGESYKHYDDVNIFLRANVLGSDRLSGRWLDTANGQGGDTTYRPVLWN